MICGYSYGMVTVPVLLGAYYTVIMAYSLLFIYYGFSSTLPWSNCHIQDEYSSYNCWSKDDSKWCQEQKQNETGYWMYFNKTCMTYEQFCGMNNYTSAGTNCISANGTNVTVDGLHFNFKTPSEDFWNTNILGLNVMFIDGNLLLHSKHSTHFNVPTGVRSSRTCGQYLVGMG